MKEFFDEPYPARAALQEKTSLRRIDRDRSYNR